MTEVGQTRSFGDVCPMSHCTRKRTSIGALAMSQKCQEATYEATYAVQQIAAYSITSSAMASTPGGMSRPSDFAVLRLMTSSNLVGCSTGKSPGLAPLRILST